MDVEIQINNSSSPDAQFVSWSPSPCRIRVTNPAGTTTAAVGVMLTVKSVAGGGAVRFRQGAISSNNLSINLAVDGSSMPFFISGEFGRPSVNNGDVTIEAHSGGALVGSVTLMVRIRKNANTLTNDERNRFVSALAQLNDQGLGRFADFRNMHTDVSSPQAHGAPGFLPWHRAYLLDLERELQVIDASVALPYWRFDRPAPNIFTSDFLGTSDPLGSVQFSATNPLQFWKTDGVQGVARRPFFDTAMAPQGVLNETRTLALGTRYADFQALEGNPHGSAHVSFGGSISSIDTAAKDPLFFLLHCNVDRLWAKWQRRNNRFNHTQAIAFDGDGSNPIGHNLADTMWPWNGVTGGERPPSAPGGALASSPCVSAPGSQPAVQAMLDYQGQIDRAAQLGFDYDDVEF